MKLAQMLVERRAELGHTQVQAAKRLGVTPKAVSRWECGEATPYATRAGVIAAYLGTTVRVVLDARSAS